MISPAKINQTTQVSQTNNSATSNLTKVPLQTQEVTPAQIKNWVAGQVLKASVIKQLSNTTLLLKIGNTQLTAKTKLSLPPGSVLQLKVVTKSEQPLLQIINHRSSKTETSLTVLRQTIPKQTPLSDLFPALKLVDQRLPQVIQHAVQSLQMGLTSRMDLLNPEGIKKALIQSGTFLESNLKDPKFAVSVDGDLKGKLLRLSDLLLNENKNQKNNAVKNSILSLLTDNKAMPDLQRHVESALARIQLNQLNSLPHDEQHSQVFLMELPIKENENIDVLSLKINEEEQQTSEQESSKRWSIKLSFDLNTLGSIHAKLTLGDEKIKASLWAEKETTFNLIQNNLNLLYERFTGAEFIDPEVKCYKGKPEAETPLPSGYNELIDVKI